MMAAATAACVFAAVWIVSLPSPATLRLNAVFRTPPNASDRPATPAVIAWVRSTVRVLRSRRRNIAKRRAAVIELCDAIAVELAAGRPGATALAEAAKVLPTMPGLARGDRRRPERRRRPGGPDPSINDGGL
jgi:tight adherence protein B